MSLWRGPSRCLVRAKGVGTFSGGAYPPSFCWPLPAGVGGGGMGEERGPEREEEGLGLEGDSEDGPPRRPFLFSGAGFGFGLGIVPTAAARCPRPLPAPPHNNGEGKGGAPGPPVLMAGCPPPRPAAAGGDKRGEGPLQAKGGRPVRIPDPHPRPDPSRFSKPSFSILRFWGKVEYFCPPEGVFFYCVYTQNTQNLVENSQMGPTNKRDLVPLLHPSSI